MSDITPSPAPTVAPVAAPAVVVTDSATPAISPKVRTIAYWVLGIAAPVIGLIVLIVGIWYPEIADPVSKTGAGIVAFIGTVAGVFGIAYRPTR